MARRVSVNVSGTFWMCRAAIRAMRDTGGGSIVNVASDWGLVGGKGHVAYCASKGAVVNMTRALALDHISDGIRINVICPGEVDTPMLRGGLARRGYDPARASRNWGEAFRSGEFPTPPNRHAASGIWRRTTRATSSEPCCQSMEAVPPVSRVIGAQLRKRAPSSETAR